MEIAPATNRVTFMFNPDSSPYSRLFYQSIETAAPKLSIAPSVALVRNAAEVEKVVATLAHNARSGLICSADAFIYTNRKVIIEAALRRRVPAIR
jgi:hypothetical protein